MPHDDYDEQITLSVPPDRGPCRICQHAWEAHFLRFDSLQGCDDVTEANPFCECAGYASE
jgi:hypothetical protein